MKCEICDREFANSEEVKLHIERDHPLDERGDDELEKPDLIDEPAQEQVPVVTPVR
jgi:hypothetical protein